MDCGFEMLHSRAMVLPGKRICRKRRDRKREREVKMSCVEGDGLEHIAPPRLSSIERRLASQLQLIYIWTDFEMLHSKAMVLPGERICRERRDRKRERKVKMSCVEGDGLEHIAPPRLSSIERRLASQLQLIYIWTDFEMLHSKAMVLPGERICRERRDRKREGEVKMSCVEGDGLEHIIPSRLSSIERRLASQLQLISIWTVILKLCTLKSWFCQVCGLVCREGGKGKRGRQK